MRGYAVSMPLLILSGHQGVVSSADWLAGGEQVVTASWDRTAAIWDVTSQTMIHSLGKFNKL
jgi:WD40 repeat protein